MLRVTKWAFRIWVVAPHLATDAPRRSPGRLNTANVAADRSPISSPDRRCRWPWTGLTSVDQRRSHPIQTRSTVLRDISINQVRTQPQRAEPVRRKCFRVRNSRSQFNSSVRQAPDKFDLATLECTASSSLNQYAIKKERTEGDRGMIMSEVGTSAE